MADPSVFALDKISEFLNVVSDTLGDSAHMVEHMSNTPESEEPGTYSLDMEGYGAETDCNPSTANDNSTWQSIYNLSSRVLNRLRIEGGDQSGDGRESRSGLLTGGEVVASKRNLL